MSQLSPILRDAADHVGGKYLLFWCPGCNEAHQVKVAGAGPWGWNGNTLKPTFTPSVLVTGYVITEEGYAMIGRGEKPPGGKYPGRNTSCHSFVTDGRIQFLNDCTHALAGQTVDLPAWNDDVDDYFNAPTKDEIDREIAEHQAGVDEVMRGRT